MKGAKSHFLPQFHLFVVFPSSFFLLTRNKNIITGFIKKKKKANYGDML